MNNLTAAIINDLKKKFTDIVTINANMSMVSQWRIGGSISVLVTPRTMEELIQIRIWIQLHQVPSFVIGNTTNLLFADEGVNAIAIQIGSNFKGIKVQDQEIIAKAGEYVPCLARKSMQHGLTGLEHIIGIPGTLGGLICMNGGSQRKAISEVITYIESIDYTGKIIRHAPDECHFSYRSSIFQKQNHIITEVGLKLKLATNKTRVHQHMLSILRERSKKFPRKLPNCGSVFVSNPIMYEKFGTPGKIIEDCGLKGFYKGGAQISPDHANFIINNGNATSKDIFYLINLIRNSVYKKTGYLMKVEAKFVDSTGKIVEI